MLAGAFGDNPGTGLYISDDQHRPVDELIMSKNTFGSKPSLNIYDLY